MSISWNFGSTAFAELDWKVFQGQPGLGFYRFMAQVGVTTHGKQADEEVAVTRISGDLRVLGKDGQEYPLGRLRQQGPETTLTTYLHTATANITLEAEWGARRIEAIERIRLGGDLCFRLALYGVARSGREKSPQSVYASLEYRANQSTWIEVLKQIGYQKMMLLEIPVPGDDMGLQFPEVTKHIQTAQTHMLRGHFRDAVGSCRDVMESLSAVLNDERDQLPEAIKSWFNCTRSMSKEERLRLVRRAFKILTHPARHADEVSTSIEWGPMDARVAVIMAAALLQIAVEA